MDKKDFMGKEFEKNKIFLTENQLNQFLTYYEMLVERNKVMNLTTITDFEEVVVKHFIDSLSVIHVIDINKDFSIIDVGTGAGFPGIPLKIIFPDLKVVLLDSLNKRVNFLKDVIDELQLNSKTRDKSIYAVHGRAEDLGQDSLYRGKFDLCVSRAVANLATLSEYCLPFLKREGLFISYKAGNIDEEVSQAKKAIEVLGGKVFKIEKFQLANTDMERSLVLVEKDGFTPKKYPRSGGKPKREPII